MIKREIKVPFGTKYLSEIMDDLPHNSYIHKGLTGVGGTTLVLTNDQPYVIAVHSVALVNNKAEQHGNVLGVIGATTDEEIAEYVRQGGQKIIVTYDSLPKVIKNINPKDFRLLVDEVQVLIRYAGVFKIKVCNALIDRTYEFKSVSYLTATPTPLKYLPAPIQTLEYVEYKWEAAVKPSIRHKYVGCQISTKTVSYILDKYFTTDSDIFVFYNSISGVSTTIKKLLKAEETLSLSDINVFFADSSKNTASFKKSLGKNFEISTPSLSNTRRINFVSSFGFEGIDFYNDKVSLLVVSDSKSKSMRYDISIDLPQIVGRFRNVPNSTIDFIWSTYTDQAKMTEEEFIENYKISSGETKELVEMAAHNTIATRAASAFIDKDQTPYMYMDDDEVVHVNKYAFESLMSSFSAMHCDYYVLGNTPLDNAPVLDKANDIFNTEDTFDISPLSPKHTKNLDRVFNFKKLAKEYVINMIESEPFTIEQKKARSEKVKELLSYSDDLAKYHGIVSPEKIHALNYNKKIIDEVYDDTVIIKSLGVNPLKLEIGRKYQISWVKQQIYNLYNINNISRTPMASHISNWYDVKKTTDRLNGEIVQVYHIKAFI